MRWTHHYKGNRRWPVEGFVAVIGSEAQDAVFIDAGLIEPTDAAHLRTTGEQRWLSTAEAAELREEVSALTRKAEISANDRLSLSQAIELVDYEISNRTGVAVAPPPA
jgi:hypothetical protein